MPLIKHDAAGFEFLFDLDLKEPVIVKPIWEMQKTDSNYHTLLASAVADFINKHSVKIRPHLDNFRGYGIVKWDIKEFEPDAGCTND